MHTIRPLVRAALVAAILLPLSHLTAGKIPIKKDETTNAVTETVNFTGTTSIGGVSLGTVTAAGAALLDDANSAAQLITLGLGSVTAAGTAILDDADASAQRTTLGLGTIAAQAASSVSISGGSITGITDLAVADGGTGASVLDDILGTANNITITSGADTIIGGDATIAISAVLDLGGNTSIEIPNGTAPTVDAAGEIAIDTNGDGAAVTKGIITYYDGTTQLYAAAYDTAPATDGHVLTYDSATNKLRWEAASGGGDTYRERWFAVNDMQPDDTTPPAIASSTTNTVLKYAAFDDTTEETLWLSLSMPEAWDAGTIKIRLYWYGTPTTGDVTWLISSLAVGDADAIEAAANTSDTVTDTVDSNSLDLNITTSAAFSVYLLGADTDLLNFGITRYASAGSDTMTGDARLIGIKIQYTENSSQPTAW